MDVGRIKSSDREGKFSSHQFSAGRLSGGGAQEVRRKSETGSFLFQKVKEQVEGRSTKKTRVTFRVVIPELIAEPLSASTGS